MQGHRVVGIVLGLTWAIGGAAQTMNTVAGNSSWGDIQNVTVDAAGNIYAADIFYHVVYKVDRLGTTTTVAGNRTRGYSGDGALATNAQLYAPTAVAVAPDGTLYMHASAKWRRTGSSRRLREPVQTALRETAVPRRRRGSMRRRA